MSVPDGSKRCGVIRFEDDLIVRAHNKLDVPGHSAEPVPRVDIPATSIEVFEDCRLWITKTLLHQSFDPHDLTRLCKLLTCGG